MNPLNNLFHSPKSLSVLFLLLGILLGWFFFHPSAADKSPAKEKTEESAAAVWTCSMHPQIRQDKPGKCPLCGMELIEVKPGGAPLSMETSAIHLSEEAAALADVQTIRISRSRPVKQLSLYGKIALDERRLQSQTAHVNGRIEHLAIDFTGESVHTEQVLATVYSPELFTAQQELLEAIRMGQPQLLQAAREKLYLWKMTKEQVEAIERSGKLSAVIPIRSNTNGIVMTKRVSQGDYVNQGTVLFDIADLSKVWALFDAFESDLPFLVKGAAIEFTVQALPGKRFQGQIAFIDPFLNPTTRTAKVRVEVSNPDGLLKPEMYAMARVEARLKGYPEAIVVPRSAVLWTGQRSIVYVKQPDTMEPAFELRTVELGPSLGDSYVILRGLHEGEEIITRGLFAVDASAQLEGKSSMMNREETGNASVHTKEASFTVRGKCEMCRKRIEQTALGQPGVHSAHWEKEKQRLSIEYDPTKSTPRAVSRALAAVGHDTEMDKAPDSIYEKLPACCHYR